MRFKSAALVLSLSLICLVPRTTFADTLTLNTTSGGSPYGVDIYPYQLTLTTSGGATKQLDLSCINYDREVSFGETWTVDAYVVGSIPSGGLDGESQTAFRADAWLFNQYNTGSVSGIGAITNSQVQYAIWDIMDSSGVNGLSGFDSTAQALATKALGEAGSLPTSYYANDVVYVPDTNNQTGWTNGQPQIFMTDPPPAPTPEPTSMALLGTGLLGAVGVMRRRLVAA